MERSAEIVRKYIAAEERCEAAAMRAYREGPMAFTAAMAERSAAARAHARDLAARGFPAPHGLVK